MRGFPWTLHLEGMHSILQGRAMNFMFHQETPERKHCLEVMGVMDLPTFSVGRQTPYIGLWHRYCRNRGDEGVEMVTGLPRSLLDIFSGIGQGTTVEDFWNWPGEQGSFLQCYLWEAHRLSGILNLRRYQTSPSMVGRDWGDASTAILRIHPHIPSREVLVTRVLANVDAIRRGCKEPGAKSTLIMNGINHPLFAAGLEVEVLNSHPEWKQLIRSCYYTDESGEFGAADRLQLQLLEEFWARNDMTLNANDLAREKGWELGLL